MLSLLVLPSHCVQIRFSMVLCFVGRFCLVWTSINQNGWSDSEVFSVERTVHNIAFISLPSYILFLTNWHHFSFISCTAFSFCVQRTIIFFLWSWVLSDVINYKIYICDASLHFWAKIIGRPFIRESGSSQVLCTSSLFKVGKSKLCFSFFKALWTVSASLL